MAQNEEPQQVGRGGQLKPWGYEITRGENSTLKRKMRSKPKITTKIMEGRKSMNKGPRRTIWRWLACRRHEDRPTQHFTF